MGHSADTRSATCNDVLYLLAMEAAIYHAVTLQLRGSSVYPASQIMQRVRFSNEHFSRHRILNDRQSREVSSTAKVMNLCLSSLRRLTSSE